MILSATVRPKLVDTLGVLKLAAGATLLVALSWEILAGDHALLTPSYLTIQFLVCVVFLCDFFVRLWLSERRGRFFVRHLFYLLISVPYLNLLAWSGVRMTHDWGILVGLVPMLRAFLAMFVIVQWMARGRRMRWLFTAISYRGGLHLSFGAGVLRLRSLRESEAPRFRECPVVGVDERHDGRCGDFPCDGCRQGGLRAAAFAGDDVFPDLHDLHFAGVCHEAEFRGQIRSGFRGERSAGLILCRRRSGRRRPFRIPVLPFRG